MFVLGLTGPSGAGKSLVAKVFEARGFAVLDADHISREAVWPGSPCLAELKAAFGEDIVDDSGALDRKALAAAAFADDDGVALLNAITHPYIMKRIEEKLEELEEKGCDYAVLDAPALFEAGGERLCDRVAAVLAPESIRLERIIRRDGLTLEEASRRVGAQRPAEFYSSRADYVIMNGGSEEALQRAAEEIADELLPADSGQNRGGACDA